MSLAWCIRELAARHKRDPDELLEAWEERAAILEYLGGCRRQTAELWAIGEVEREFAIGLHDPEARRRWTSGTPRCVRRAGRQLRAGLADHHDNEDDAPGSR